MYKQKNKFIFYFLFIYKRTVFIQIDEWLPGYQGSDFLYNYRHTSFRKFVCNFACSTYNMLRIYKLLFQ